MNPFKIITGKMKRLFHRSNEISGKFHEQFYYSKNWSQTTWLGVQLLKCPMDLWIYQEIINETRPDVLIETGTYNGGSALFFANLFDLIGNGEVITIDVKRYDKVPEHKRITYLLGPSYSHEIVEKVKGLIENKKRIMINLDSEHTKECVLKELEIYGKYVTKGCYAIVEDTNVNGHPVYTGYGQEAGPMEAVDEFLLTHNEFVIDKSKEKYMLTFNPRGYLKKIS